MKYIIPVLFLFPVVTFAQDVTAIVPCGYEGAPDCQACHLVELADNIVRFLVQMGALLGTLAIIIAGVLLLSSGANMTRRQKAKSMIKNVVIGFLILIGAWFLVDTIIKQFVDSEQFQFGVWNQVQCTKPLTPSTSGTKKDDVKRDSKDDVKGDVNVVPQTELKQLRYTAESQAQTGDVSSALGNLLVCMEQKMPAGVGLVTSISDSQITSGEHTWEQCAAGQCQHAANSCHYGGRSCVGKSYAVDFGDEENAGSIITAAQSCGATSVINEGNHIHVSVGKECGCN